MVTMLGRGVYNFREVATLTGLSPGRVRDWFRGRHPEKDRKPLFDGDYPPVNDQYALSFHDLIDVYVVGLQAGKRGLLHRRVLQSKQDLHQRIVAQATLRP